MKWGYYFVSLASAIILIAVVFIYTDPNWDRQHSKFALFFSIFAFSANIAVLAIYPFMKTDFLARMVKRMGIVSMISIALLAATGHSNYEVKVVFSRMGSQTPPGIQPNP